MTGCMIAHIYDVLVSNPLFPLIYRLFVLIFACVNTQSQTQSYCQFQNANPHILLLQSQTFQRIIHHMKNYQIDMGTLSQTQRKMCVQLLAQSNIQFSQKGDQFVAEIKVDNKKTSGVEHNPKVDKSKVTPRKENKKQPSAIGSNGKKLLSRTVKIGDLTRLQSLHREIQVYVYPKKLSAINFIQFIQNTYDKFWFQHKKKSPKNLSFPQWFHNSIIAAVKDKLKSEQLLVSLIQSLHHFMIKQPGLRLFYNFLAQIWPIDTLFYFLVIRGILEQIVGERIMEKTNSSSLYGPASAKLKMNPYQKQISQQQVISFLGVLFNGGLSCSRNRKRTYDQLYQTLTQHMYFDQIKRKNYISFYGLVQRMLLQFMDGQVSCTLSISKTLPDDNYIHQLDTSQEISKEFQVSKESNRQQSDRPVLQTKFVMELDPCDEERVEQQFIQSSKYNFKQVLKEAVLAKVRQLYQKMHCQVSRQTYDALTALTSAVSDLDKSAWVRYRGAVGQSQLLAIQRLQGMYRERQHAPILVNTLVKGMLLIPQIRQRISSDLPF